MKGRAANLEVEDDHGGVPSLLVHERLDRRELRAARGGGRSLAAEVRAPEAGPERAEMRS